MYIYENTYQIEITEVEITRISKDHQSKLYIGI
jgi:hypothetical protein